MAEARRAFIRRQPALSRIIGFSAGGNLAMLAAYSMGDPRLPPSCDVPTVSVKSVINLYGPTARQT